MFGFIKNAFTARRDHADCSGCSLCLLVCPVWRQSRDISLTPHGRAKAIQHGDAVDTASVESCTLCMACEPVCPEEIDQIDKILKLRRSVAHPQTPTLMAKMEERAAQPITTKHAQAKLLPDQALLDHPETLRRIVSLLGIPLAEDDGADIALALEAGVVITAQRMQRFLVPFHGAKKIVVTDGLLLKHLKQLLPTMAFVSLGEALSGHSDVRRNLRSTDLYVIEPRAYHTDYQRLVKYYDRLRAAHGCAFNLDLQRIVIPATSRNLPQRLGLIAHDDDAQARWVLHGRSITRIVVESLEDRAAFEKISDIPVVHLAELADDGGRVGRAALD
jgi:NAD-dependent dihydropyrimidine dehydrogenase PreA subunit